jgi:hypothetical protein
VQAFYEVARAGITGDTTIVREAAAQP